MTGTLDLSEIAPSETSWKNLKQWCLQATRYPSGDRIQVPAVTEAEPQPSTANPLDSALVEIITTDVTTLPEVKESSSGIFAVSYKAVIAKGDFTLDSLPWGYTGYAFRYMTNDFCGSKIEGDQRSQNGLYALAVLNGKVGLGRQARLIRHCHHT